MCLKVSAHRVKFKIQNPSFLLKYFHEHLVIHQHMFQTMYRYDTVYLASHVLLYYIAALIQIPTLKSENLL